MKKVRTMEEAYRVFEYLGIKDVTKKWQKAKGTEVWELPQKTMYYNGHGAINRFTMYRNGYIRKMIVYGENNASKGCYQLNRVRKVANFVKDYKWNEAESDMVWTGKYRKIYNNERIMIDNHRDRVVYLCNYILKNYYRKMNLVGDYTIKRMETIHGEWWRNERKIDTLPFRDEDDKFFSSTDDVQVIINGHRYNLS
tara:strand:- start:345 stop:935 length:591 start_codon:yes stop_codon:yes gene_type:complete